MAVECKISVKHLLKIGFKDKKYFNAGMIYLDYQKCLKNSLEVYCASLCYHV